MTEDTQSEDVQEDNIPSELETLKARANMRGITFHPKIGLDKLKAKLKAADNEEEATNVAALQDKNSGMVAHVTPISHTEFTRMSIKDRKKKAGSLIRINVSSMNQNKKNWEGEIISVGSAKLGTFKKYIPFNTTDGWHVPYIVYEAMKERKCTVFHTVKDAKGNKKRMPRSINEFNIEVLPPLTKVQLKELAQRQSMAGNIDAA